MTLVSGYKSRGQVEKLFSTVDPQSDPEGLISRYLEYELHRLKQPDIDPGGPLRDRHKLLNWYCLWYALMRHDDGIRVPISKSQEFFLNSAMPIADGSLAITVVLYNAVLDSLPSHANLRDSNLLDSAVYWWCFEKAPILRLDDRLVTESQVALLQSVCQWEGSDCPFTVFMREYFNRHTELHFLDMSDTRDRFAFLYYLILLSFSNPVVARYLPRHTYKLALKPTKNLGSASPLEKIIERHALLIPDAMASKRLISQGEQILGRSGFSFSGKWVRPRYYNGNSGDCFLDPEFGSKPIEDGVAVIGPIFSTSGLGQATRLSFSALLSAEQITPTVMPFKLDNPAPIGFATKISFSRYKQRRSINLIHLNAESIPLAFAYTEKAVFETSYNIGYFFWELSKIPKCHSLALELLDEIWVSSEYNREIYANVTDIPVINVGMAVEPPPPTKSMDRKLLGIDTKSFVFLTTFDSFSFIERKNPLAVINAFKMAFSDHGEDVRLVIKTQNRTRVSDPYQHRIWNRIDRAISSDSRIMVIDETYEYSELIALKLTCDCYVSLHRSEGWGFGMIEAMQLGRPVICTAYSGNLEFCNDKTAYMVGYELISPLEQEYIFVPRGSVWADPSIPGAAGHMREVFQFRQQATQKALAAARLIKKKFSLEAVAKNYANRLKEIRSKNFLLSN